MKTCPGCGVEFKRPDSDAALCLRCEAAALAKQRIVAQARLGLEALSCEHGVSVRRLCIECEVAA
ncbi:MAG: hypothetical protein KGL39_12790 [Patescibacteria group bacterium]|nr:hypothetical protein [Patescibacteria group bacterium]